MVARNVLYLCLCTLTALYNINHISYIHALHALTLCGLLLLTATIQRNGRSTGKRKSLQVDDPVRKFRERVSYIHLHLYA